MNHTKQDKGHIIHNAVLVFALSVPQSNLAADLPERITDDNVEDPRAQFYDFSTFGLKSSSTSEFKLWWETSLGCEHLISPGWT